MNTTVILYIVITLLNANPCIGVGGCVPNDVKATTINSTVYPSLTECQFARDVMSRRMPSIPEAGVYVSAFCV